jgi:putative sugar O-methyltransferase
MDSIGGPRKYKFKSYGVYSPNALKYLKVYLELRSLFGDLSKFRIAEIGVGFGGQAIVIYQLNKAFSYHLYDIPPVLKLANKVLNSLNLNNKFYFMDGIHPESLNSDLLISNDAFSELSRKTQDDYIEKVVLNSARGYITWNSWSSSHLGGYKLADLVRLIPNSQIFPEKPLTGQENAIIVWGHDLK